MSEWGAPMGPSGFAMPQMMSAPMPVTRSGVKILPMMSTTRDSVMVSSSTSAKNANENGSIPMLSPTEGTTAISYVVAAVRGMAIKMPVQTMAAVFRMLAGIFPMVRANATSPPPAAFNA